MERLGGRFDTVSELKLRGNTSSLFRACYVDNSRLRDPDVEAGQ